MPWRNAAFFFEFVLICVALVVTCVGQSNPELDDSAERTFFENKVRPLIESRCKECHSALTERSGGLSLDSKQGWMIGGDSGPAVDVNAWEKSLVWDAVQYRNPHLQMPPDGKLPEGEIETLRKWLGSGAFDPREDEITTSPSKKATALSVQNAKEHWAYRPLSRDLIQPPQSTSRNGIDAFLANRQSNASVFPEQVAAPEVLLQRLYVDLHGMRPDVGSVTPDFDYEQLVDSLLASPRFGERFARRWMDVVRYAESITLRGFVLPDAWRYRNYLIHAFNSDTPYSTFVQEQIAGDLMSANSIEERQKQFVATTMLALGDTNLEEQDKKQLEMDYVDEQLDVIGKAFLAQTLSCARCHNHKFDPIPTKDYYALAGILRSSVAMEHANVSNWIRVPLPLAPDQLEYFSGVEKELAETKKAIESIQRQLKSNASPSLVIPIAELLGTVVDDSMAKKIGNWEASSSVKAYVGDGYLHDQNKDKGSKSVTFEPKELLPGKYRVRIAYSHGENRATNAVVRIFSADGESDLRINQRQVPKDDGLWQTLGSFRFEQGGQAFVIVSNEQSDGHVIVDAIQFLPEAVQVKDGSQEAKVIADNATSVSEKNESFLAKSKDLEVRQKALQAKVDARPMVMTVRPSESPADIAIHVRGNVHQLGEVVPRGFLSCLSVENASDSISSTSNGRLELANWLANERNPLTARVYVNRVWAWLMGEGIVRTVDNFGTTGEVPSNPELLDWLTQQFIAHQWSTKWLVREIVCSDAYKRSSKSTLSGVQNGTESGLFARGHVRRLDAESIRDTLLNMSGELVQSAEVGSTVPPELKEDYAFKHSVGYRSVYGPWFRNSLPELYNEFDGANPSVSINQRDRSTVVPQALALLNSPWVGDRCSKVASFVVAKDDWSLDQKIDYCFLATVSRLPTDTERQWSLSHRSEGDDSASVQEVYYTNLIHSLVASIDFRFVE